MVALDLDDAFFDRTAGTAHHFELLAHQCQGSGIHIEPFNQRDAFTFSALGHTGDSYVTITGWRCLFATGALFNGMTTAGTDSTVFGGVDNSIPGELGFHLRLS